MKKFIAPALVLLATTGLYAACIGPFCYDDQGAYINSTLTVGNMTHTQPDGLLSKTLAQMNLLAPTAAGQLIYVSDAVQSRVCVSSGTGAGAWVVMSASGTFAGGSYPHCN